jgi:predicted secreted Zn-dependent protease
MTSGDAAPQCKGSVSKPSRQQNSDGSWTATTNVKFSPTTPVINIAPVSWPNMTPADQAAVAAYNQEVQAHEDGHANIAQDICSKSSAPVSANASTAAGAIAALQSKVNDARASAQASLDEAEAAYDAKTDHGANQAADGGRDIFLQCP